MKKVILGFMMIMMLAIMMPLAANAQEYVRRYIGRDGRVHYTRVRKPNFYKRHRNLSNIAIGTGGGAIVGALIGGKKGALIGTGVGAGSSALYTYKIRPQKKKYYRVRNY